MTEPSPHDLCPRCRDETDVEESYRSTAAGFERRECEECGVTYILRNE